MLHPLNKSGMTDADLDRRARIEDGLRNQFDGVIQTEGWWPHVRSVDDEMRDWNALLPALYKEWKHGGGDVTDFYVGGMMDIAAKAIRSSTKSTGRENEPSFRFAQQGSVHVFIGLAFVTPAR